MEAYQVKWQYFLTFYEFTVMRVLHFLDLQAENARQMELGVVQTLFVKVFMQGSVEPTALNSSKLVTFFEKLST